MGKSMWEENNTQKKNYHKYLDLLTNTIIRPMLIKSLIFKLKFVKRNFIVMTLDFASQIIEFMIKICIK